MEGDFQSTPQMQVVTPVRPPCTYQDLLNAIQSARDAVSNANPVYAGYMAWTDHLKRLLALQEKVLNLSLSPAPMIAGTSWIATDGNR